MNDNEGDAKWLAEQVILPAVNGLRESMEKRDEKLWEELTEQRKCLTYMKLNAEKERGKRKAIEQSVARVEKTHNEHADDELLHFNPYHSEKLGHKLWRKKSEVTVTSGSGVAIALGILKWMGAI